MVSVPTGFTLTTLFKIPNESRYVTCLSFKKLLKVHVSGSFVSLFVFLCRVCLRLLFGRKAMGYCKIMDFIMVPPWWVIRYEEDSFLEHTTRNPIILGNSSVRRCNRLFFWRTSSKRRLVKYSEGKDDFICLLLLGGVFLLELTLKKRWQLN